MTLPKLDLSGTMFAIRENRIRIQEEIVRHEREIAELRGLHQENQSMCKHPSKLVYEDYAICENCGWNVYG